MSLSRSALSEVIRPRRVSGSPTKTSVGRALEFHGFGAETVVRRDEVDIEFPTSNWHGARAGLEP
jgi:hypothetical protein